MQMRISCSILLICIVGCGLLPRVCASSDAKALQEARKMRSSGDLAGAIAVLRGVTAGQPENTRALALLGDSLMDSGDASAAHAA